MPFTGRSNVSGRATANADSGGPVGAMAFYGDAPSGCWGPPARAARRKSDEPALDLTTKQESKGAARASTRGKYLGGIQPRDAKPPVNTEEGAAESDDDDFQIRLHSPVSTHDPSPNPSSARGDKPLVIDGSSDPVEDERLLSECESEEIRATQSPPSSPPRTRRDGGDGFAENRARARRLSEIERKRDKHTGNGGVLRLTRGKLTARRAGRGPARIWASGRRGLARGGDGFGRRGVRLSDGVDDGI